MNLSRRSLTPVQVRLVDPDIRVVSPHATMNVQTSSPLSKLSFSMDVELYQLKTDDSSLCHYSDFNPSWIVNGVLLLNHSCVTLI